MNTERKKILVAEDDNFIRKAYRDALSRAGFEVVLAVNGTETLEKAKAEQPDLILLDLVMPAPNGFEVAGTLKNDPSMCSIPIIITSNLGQDADIEKGKKLGVADYMVKSNFSVHQVIERIRFHLSQTS